MPALPVVLFSLVWPLFLVVVAGGVQTMTQIPISSAMIAAKPLGFSDPFSGSEGWVRRFGSQPVSQFVGAQMIADKWKISREEMEKFSLESHVRARKAIADGRIYLQAANRMYCIGNKEEKRDAIAVDIEFTDAVELAPRNAALIARPLCMAMKPAGASAC